MLTFMVGMAGVSLLKSTAYQYAVVGNSMQVTFSISVLVRGLKNLFATHVLVRVENDGVPVR